MLSQDKQLQEDYKAVAGDSEKVEALLNNQTESFFSMVSGKWKELKGRVLEIFVRSM